MERYHFVFAFILCTILNFSTGSPVWLQNVEEFNEHSNDVNIELLLNKLGISLQKPTFKWKIPKKLLTYPTSCELLNYCTVESAPPAGVYRRHPIFPWWYYSCQQKTVKCHSCQQNIDDDQPTLFFSERCQKCISAYEDNIDCIKHKIRFEK